MTEVRGGLDFAKEAIRTEGGGELGSQHLDCHPAAVLHVLREVDCGHAPRAELALEAVTIGKGGPEPREGVGHVGRWVEAARRWGGWEWSPD